MADEIFDRVKKVVVKNFDAKPEEVTETAAFDDLGADSLMVVELIMGLEEEFNTTIADEEAQGLKTIGDVVEFIKNKLK